MVLYAPNAAVAAKVAAQQQHYFNNALLMFAFISIIYVLYCAGTWIRGRVK